MSRNASNAIIVVMATLTVRRIDEDIKAKLRVRAASRGHSMEQEVREILKGVLDATGDAPGEHIVDAIRRRMKSVGGVTLPQISREPAPDRVRFDK